MLNIGRIRPGGAEYYVGEIATSAEDYYLGHGEAPGRWVGSLAADLEQRGDWFAPGTVLVVDEASMVGTRDLARLATHVQRAGGSIKLIGDPDQHASVDTGGVFKALAARDDPTIVRLAENRRQINPLERRAIDEYRQGEIAAALDRYDGTGEIRRSDTAAGTYDAMVRDWWADRRNGLDGATFALVLDAELALEKQQAKHDAFAVEHEGELHERRLLSLARAARRLKIRIEAVTDPPQAMLDLIGDRPTGQRERLRWDGAVESVAVHLDETGRGWPDHATSVGDILGRGHTPRDRFDHDRVANELYRAMSPIQADLDDGLSLG